MPTRLAGRDNPVAGPSTEPAVPRGRPGWRAACSNARAGSMARRFKLRLACAAALLGAVLACNTPSVPLPPPDLPALSFQSAQMSTPGLVVLQGMPTGRHANARFYVVNLALGDGVITTAKADGSFTTSPFAAADGDKIELYFDTPAGERSQNACVALHLNTPLLSIPCF